jgi:long-chain acyl-CoA synthetase
MNVAHLLVRSGHVFADSPAIFHGEHLICNYRILAQRAASIGNSLSHGLRLIPGDRVAIFMSNTPEYLEILYGLWFAGLVAVPVNARLHIEELNFILRDSGAKVLFVSPDLEASGIAVRAVSSEVRTVIDAGSGDYWRLTESGMLERPVERSGGDVAWLFYTSGTTGHPKGVMQTHRNLWAMTMCYYADVDQVAHQDRVIYAAPMSHAAGLSNFAFVIAGSAHVFPASARFDPAEITALAAFHQRVSLFAAPTMVKRLVEYVAASTPDCSGIKTVLYGGGPMYLEDIRKALDVMGDRFVQIYGQAETPMTITALSRRHLSDRNHPRYMQRVASVGVAQSAVEVRVTDPEGQTLPIEQVGEVLVRGDTVMKGYWNNPKATAEALRGGWLWTGDLGSFDADGFLTLRDRSKDLIISGGANIYPREVEEVLLLDPGVREVAVVGRPHVDWGEEVVAFVVVCDNGLVTAEALDALCLRHIARFKRPRSYRFVRELPKNNYGKILKKALREELVAELRLDGGQLK